MNGKKHRLPKDAAGGALMLRGYQKNIKI